LNSKFDILITCVNVRTKDSYLLRYEISKESNKEQYLENKTNFCQLIASKCLSLDNRSNSLMLEDEEDQL